MDLHWLGNLGVGGILAYIIFKEFMGYLSKRNGNSRVPLPVCPLTITVVEWEKSLTNALTVGITPILQKQNETLQKQSEFLSIITHNQENFLGRITDTQDNIIGNQARIVEMLLVAQAKKE